VNVVRCSENPIVKPGRLDWRRAATYNPAAIIHNNEFYLFERAAASLRPHQCWIGLLKSQDGVHFTQVGDKPVFTPAMMGWPQGSVQDPRVTRIGDLFYMVYAVRPYSVHFGQKPGFKMTDAYPAFSGKEEDNWSRSGIAASRDLLSWENLGFCTPEGWDDRDNMLFPEKINGSFAMLRRPQWGRFESMPSAVRISYSTDLREWSYPEVVMQTRPGVWWEAGKIGGSTPPIATDKGWLILYHAVDAQNVYRVGAALLDRSNPRKVLARSKCPILEPLEGYERTGLFIGNVVFPCGAVVKDGLLWIYYGCSDYTIAMATVGLAELLEFLEVGGGEE
jgi:predicted GH43/DUF377 family glycosyl hydrolase